LLALPVRPLAILAFLATVAGACNDSPVAVEPVLRLSVVSGDLQENARGEELERDITVRLVDGADQPVAGAEVRWRVLSGGGAVRDLVVTTDDGGNATTRWTLGLDRGEQLLLATAGSESVTLRATSFFRYVAVSAGFRHTCALSNLGEAYCWGANHKGQLGDGTETRRDQPVAVLGGLRFREIAAGWSHTCAVARSGELFCWGDNAEGQLGLADVRSTQLPALVATPEELGALSASFLHSCGLTASGEAFCWGANDQGQLGRPGAFVGPAPVATSSRYSRVSAGEFHTCAVTSGDGIECWGWNSIGELGTGDPFGATRALPHPVAPETAFTEVAAGVRHTCALGEGGRAWCWGRSATGEIGRDPSDHTAIPDTVPSSLSLDRIGTGNAHTCALARGTAYCFGNVLGDGSGATSVTPVRVTGDLTFAALSVGFGHACGLTEREIWCWGANDSGQLGSGDVDRADRPIRVPDPRR
jgi:alpha-tubulin suppressor-like RCC1 family protein